MQIRQVSAALDIKLAQLDKKLKQLEQEHRTDPSQQLKEDIEALLQVRTKLEKSKALAWRAHELQDQNDDAKRARQRFIGLSLCAISLIGAAVLLFFALA
ncbi:MAG: hypothetical protein B0W54_01795 [Cellvibrio sp. 79]|nr:MAG: hypothetical protein B0W54_01795 [Cellvibrio sp. 79]